MSRVSNDAIESCGCDVMRVPPTLPLPPATPEEAAREARRRDSGAMVDVFDAHVHLFPDALYAALWRWFDAHAWEIAFRGTAEQTLTALAEHGTSRSVALIFAHKAGMARHLNAWLAALCRSAPGIVGVGTVLPGEPDDLAIVQESLDLGLRGLKLHCHVQKLAIDDPRVVRVLAECARLGVPAVVHAGREPATQAYGVDAHVLCNVRRTQAVLEQLPSLRLVVPHIGADEFAAYLSLLDVHPGLFLDTAMACASYFDAGPDWPTLEAHADRVMYGTDFPIVPYGPDRELTVLARRVVQDAAFDQLVRGTAQRFWGP